MDIKQNIIEVLPRLRRYAYGLSGSVERGDDLVQSACIRAIEKSDQWQPGTKFDSWIFRITKNIFTDAWRTEKVKERVLDQIQQESEQHSDYAQLDNYVSLFEIREAMNKLSSEHKSILMLICVEGYSYQEVSTILSIPVGTVASRIVRARNALLKESNTPLKGAGL